MAKVFYVRHQAAGIMHEFPFAEPPTEAQQKAVAKVCFLRFGASHKKTPGEPYWTRVEERELFDAKTLPPVPEVTIAPVSVKGHGRGEVGELSVQGRGHVENPPESMTLTDADIGEITFAEPPAKPGTTR